MLIVFFAVIQICLSSRNLKMSPYFSGATFGRKWLLEWPNHQGLICQFLSCHLFSFCLSHLYNFWNSFWWISLNLSCFFTCQIFVAVAENQLIKAKCRTLSKRNYFNVTFLHINVTGSNIQVTKSHLLLNNFKCRLLFKVFGWKISSKVECHERTLLDAILGTYVKKGACFWQILEIGPSIQKLGMCPKCGFGVLIWPLNGVN